MQSYLLETPNGSPDTGIADFAPAGFDTLDRSCMGGLADPDA